MSILPIFRGTNNNDHRIQHAYDPLDDFHKKMDHHHHSLFSPHIPFHHNKITPFHTTKRVEFDELPEAYMVRAEVPGLKKDDIKVTVEDGRVLKINGEKKIEKEERNENWHHFERGKEKFYTALTLPENVRVDQMRSSLDNGVLVVHVPKNEVKKSHVKEVEIKG